MNNAITKIKSALEGTNSRITEAEERIHEVEDKWSREEKIKIELKEMRTTSEPWDNVKCPNIRIIGVPEEEEAKKKGHKKILE